LGVISGLVSMVSMAPEGAVAVKGGNWRLFDKMAEVGANKVHLNTSISTVTRNSATGKFTLKASGSASTAFEGFDEVVIASPYQFANLSFPTSKLSHVPDVVPYVTLHVTLYTSPRLLSPAYFKLAPDSLVPLVVLTTLAEDEEPGTKTPYPGKAGFFSISMLRPIVNPESGNEEYLYKIFSARPVDVEFLSQILGINPEDRPKDLTGFKKSHVSWIHQKEWQSYPVEYPRVSYEPVKLDLGVWYTGGMDSFISCMETNALMGMNVARLMVDEWIAGGAAKMEL